MHSACTLHSFGNYTLGPMRLAAQRGSKTIGIVRSKETQLKKAMISEMLAGDSGIDAQEEVGAEENVQRDAEKEVVAEDEGGGLNYPPSA